MRKPHPRLAHANWTHNEIYREFRSDWHYITKIYSVPWKQTDWTAQQNELNWECILRWRLRDAFHVPGCVIGVSTVVMHAFEAILMADQRGETVVTAYAYARGAIKAGLVPWSASKEQQVGGAVAEREADGAEPDHAHGLAAGVAEATEGT